MTSAPQVAPAARSSAAGTGCGKVILLGEHSVVHGRHVVRDGQLTTLDLPALLVRHRALANALVAG